MADRVSASITLGGVLTPARYAELATIIAYERLSTEWDEELFAPDQRTEGEPLRLFAHEVAWGRFDELEPWCIEHRLPFARWAGAFGGQWSAERIVFTGTGEPVRYTADEDDHILIDHDTALRLGSIKAIAAHFNGADFVIPPLVIDDQSG